MESSQSRTATTPRVVGRAAGSERGPEHEIVESEIAVDERAAGFGGRDVGAEPIDEGHDGGLGDGDAIAVLASPTLELAPGVLIRAAESGETDRGGIDAV